MDPSTIIVEFFYKYNNWSERLQDDGNHQSKKDQTKSSLLRERSELTIG